MRTVSQILNSNGNQSPIEFYNVVCMMHEMCLYSVGVVSWYMPTSKTAALRHGC